MISLLRSAGGRLAEVSYHLRDSAHLFIRRFSLLDRFRRAARDSFSFDLRLVRELEQPMARGLLPRANKKLGTSSASEYVRPASFQDEHEGGQSMIERLVLDLREQVVKDPFVPVFDRKLEKVEGGLPPDPSVRRGDRYYRIAIPRSVPEAEAGVCGSDVAEDAVSGSGACRQLEATVAVMNSGLKIPGSYREIGPRMEGDRLHLL
jgi:hypothetical protein